MKSLVLVVLVLGQSSRGPTTVSTSAPTSAPTSTAQPTNRPTGNGPLALTPEERAQQCRNGATNLVNSYKVCFPLFPNTSPTTQQADQQSWAFINCICESNWRAGTQDQIRSSIPPCPAIPGITKGEQAAVAADCLAPSSQKTRVIQSFKLRTFVNGKAYVPLSGLPPGITSGTSRASSLFGLLISVLCVVL